jgi:glutamate carboxypeptidase
LTATALDLLEELVSIPSHVSQPAGISAVASAIGRELSALGFEASTAEPPERTAPSWAEEVLSPGVAFDELLDPVVWTRQGSGQDRLLLLGDLDSALALPADRCRLQVRGDRAIGPAVADMKGGLVVMVEALRRLADDSRSGPPITVVLSGDEQAGSLRSARTIRHHGEMSRWALCLECARDGGRVMRSRGHIGVGRLSATGTEAHAGSNREAGANAVALLAEAIVALEEASLSDRTATVTPTIVAGGTRRSVVPADASVVLDVRARDAASWSRIEMRMRGVLGSLPGADRLRLELYAHRPGLPATRRTEWLLGVVAELGGRQGLAIDALDSLAAGSSAFLDSQQVAVLDGMGPEGGALMTANEYVRIPSIGERAELLAATITALAGVDGNGR